MMEKIKKMINDLDITKMELKDLLTLAEIINEIDKYETNKCFKNTITSFGFSKGTIDKEDYCD